MNRSIPTLPLVLTAIPLVLAGLAACDSTGQTVDDATASIVEGSPEAIGVVRFLNDAGTTQTLLDDDVRLPSHAARNLVAHRNGPDGIHGTNDDDAYDTVAEIDAVPQIGPSRLQALVAYAEGASFVPEGDDLLGTYDGVDFSVDEAITTLAFVNAATEVELDDTVGLDRRAVNSIIAARSLPSVLALSKLYFVGGSALAKLKAYADSATAAQVGDDCAEHDDCVTGARCEGRPYDGSPAIGKCVAIGNVPGANDDCTADADCVEGTACAGLTVYNGSGYCRPLWMFGTFSSSDVAVPIPDNDPAGASMDLVVYGLATVPEDIVVTLDIDHPRPQDLVVRLVSTNGSDSVLWNQEASPSSVVPAFGIERDNYINGRLTLEVVDTSGGSVGVIRGFQVWASSRYD